MMDDFNSLITRYTTRHSQLIKNICAPLRETLEIPVFTYYTVEENGSFTILSSAVEQLEFYYQEKLYLSNDYLAHPGFFRSGYNVTEAIDDPINLEVSKKKFNIDTFFQILQCNANKMEGFLFAKQHKTNSNQFFFNHLDLLQKFCGHFKRETKDILGKMKKDGYNLKEAKGELFLKHDISLPLSNHNPKVIQFGKSINPLSPREQECLNLFKIGHSAQSTAALLGLSQRTVEHYFEQIKLKFGCQSKRDLLDL